MTGKGDSTVPKRAAARSLEDPTYRAAVLDLLGLLAHGELASFARLADDAAHAPDLTGRLTLSRMAAGELSHIDVLEQHVTRLGGELEAEMLAYADVLGDFDARTIPRDWWERLVKTYVGYGLVLDFQRELGGRLDPVTRALVEDALADNGYADYVVSVLAPVLAAEPQLGARLALWGRRVVGEALGIAQNALVKHPSLVRLLASRAGDESEDEAEATRVLNRLAGGHARRMDRLGLTA